MARTLDKKAIKNRIKENKTTMRENKKLVTTAMGVAMKGEEIDGPATRKSMSNFVTAAGKLRTDVSKLASMETNDESN